jgi:hypothetical protein
MVRCSSHSRNRIRGGRSGIPHRIDAASDSRIDFYETALE